MKMNHKMKAAALLFVFCTVVLCGCSAASGQAVSASSSAPAASSAVASTESTPASSASSEAESAPVLEGYIGDGTGMSVVTVDTADGCGYMFRMDDISSVMQGNVEYGAAVTIRYSGKLSLNNADDITVESFVIDNNTTLAKTKDGISIRTLEGTVDEATSMNELVILAGNGQKYAFSGIQDVPTTGNTAGGIVIGNTVVVSYTGEMMQQAEGADFITTGVTTVGVELK